MSIFLSGGRQRVEGAIDALINAFYQSDLKSRISFGFEKAIDVVTPNETDPFFTGMVIRTEAEAECATEGIPSSGTANLVKPFCQCEATAGPGEVTYPPEPFWELRDTFKVGYRLKLAKQAQRVCDTVVVSTFYQSNGRTQESRCEAAAEGLVPHAREAMERDLGVVFEGWLGAPAEPSLHPEYERIKRATVDEAITRCPAVLPGVTMPDRSPNGERFCFDNPAGTVIKNWQRYRRYVQVGAARGAE